jgi:hypothetical protein
MKVRFTDQPSHRKISPPTHNAALGLNRVKGYGSLFIEYFSPQRCAHPEGNS